MNLLWSQCQAYSTGTATNYAPGKQSLLTAAAVSIKSYNNWAAERSTPTPRAEPKPASHRLNI